MDVATTRSTEGGDRRDGHPHSSSAHPPTALTDRPSDGTTAAVPEGPRRAMSQLYGEPFGHVRLRVTDQETTALGGSAARAVTYGDTVWLRPADYRPGSITTDAILAHELAHVRQQSMAGSTGTADLERAADQAAALSLAPARARGRAPGVRGGPQLQRCTGSVAPENLTELDAVAKAAVVHRVIEEDRYNKPQIVYAVFASAAEQGQFVDLQGPLDMAEVLMSVDTWTAVRIGSLGPVIEGVEVLTTKRAELIRDMTHDYGLAYAQLFTAFVFDTTQDDQISAVLRSLAAERRLGDTVGKMPAIQERLARRGIMLADFPDRPREAGDVVRGLGQGVSDILDSSRVAQESRGSTLQFRILDLPGPYREAGSEINNKMLEEAFSPGNVAIGLVDQMLLGVPSGVYGFVSGTASGLADIASGNLEEGARELVPALITLATLLIGRAVRGGTGAGGPPPPPAVRGGGGRVRFGAPVAGGALTVEQAVAQFPTTLRYAADSLLKGFTGPEILEGSGYVRRSAPAAALVEQNGAPGLRSLLKNGGDVPKATLMLPAVVAAMTGSTAAKPGTAPPTVVPTAQPMPTEAEMEKATTAAKDAADLQTIVEALVKNRTGTYQGPLPLFWPALGGKGLTATAPNPANSITVGRRLTRVKPAPARDPAVVATFTATNTVLTGQAVHHVTPLMMGGPDSVDNLTAVWISYHTAGHSLLRAQHQLPPLGYSHDPQQHANNTAYMVVLVI